MTSTKALATILLLGAGAVVALLWPREAAPEQARERSVRRITSEEVVDFVCQRFARCGKYAIRCPKGRCSYSIESVTYEQCVADAEDWSCVLENGAEAVAECMAFVQTRSCVDEEELKRHIGLLNRGQESFLSDHNQGCRDLGELWQQCRLRPAF
jgi:hypothetical protein